jgi:hypothetical protein
MTAGHCITAVKQLKAQGFEIVECNLLDSLGVNPQFHEPIPFNWDDANPFTVEESEAAFDHGILTLSSNLRALVASNGVVPLTEDFWRHGQEVLETYLLVGVPEQWLTPTGIGRMNITTMIARLEKTERGDFPEVDAPMFYGRLRRDPLTNMRGMSGGPIFGFLTSETGVQHYYLVAMQSSKLGGDRDISAMLMEPLAELMDAMARGSGDASP